MSIAVHSGGIYHLSLVNDFEGAALPMEKVVVTTSTTKIVAVSMSLTPPSTASTKTKRRMLWGDGRVAQGRRAWREQRRFAAAGTEAMSDGHHLAAERYGIPRY